MTEHKTWRWKRPNFTTSIVLGILLGVAWGFFWGESGIWVKWIGDVFVGLLQMAVLPWELVGLDIEMAHELARDIGVTIEFVPFAGEVTGHLLNDHFDIGMSGLEGTIHRAMSLPHIEPYLDVTIAFVVRDHRRAELRSLQQASEREDVQVAVVAGTKAADAKKRYPEITFVELKSEREFFESQPPVADIRVTSAEAGAAWTLKFPRFAVVKPSDVNVRVPLYYYVADESRLEEFLENWLDIRRSDGTIQQLYEYWILGEDRNGPPPRWSILRDVLGYDQDGE